MASNNDDIIQEQDVPMEEETPFEDADLYQEEEIEEEEGIIVETTESIKGGQAVEPFPVGKDNRSIGKVQRRIEGIIVEED